VSAPRASTQIGALFYINVYSVFFGRFGFIHLTLYSFSGSGIYMTTYYFQQSIIPSERIESRIFLIRGRKVMFDRDLAELYGVKTKILNQAVKRNLERFPADFMFILSPLEMKNWRSQIVTSNSDVMGLRYRPRAFTEQGVAMLSSVLNSRRAILVNVQIIRTFTKIREMIASNDELRKRLDELENRYDEQFRTVFDAIRQLLKSEETQSAQIGFKTDT
jgi:hypothetical protein